MIRIVSNYWDAAVLVHKRLDTLDALFLAGFVAAGFLAGVLFSRWPS